VDNTGTGQPGHVDLNCQILATLQHFGVIASRAWNFMVLLQMVYLIKMNISRSTVWKFCGTYIHLFVWFSALACALVPLGLSQIGPGFGGCHIIPKYKYTELWTYTLPISIFWVASLITLYIVLSHREMFSLRMIYLRSFTLAEERSNRNPNLTLLLGYTVTFLLLWIPSLILRYLDLSDQLSQQYLFLDSLIIIAQGIINSVIWLIWRKTWPKPNHFDFVDNESN